MIKPAMLVLEDGSQFHGRSIGTEGIVVGEVVFNTSMTGYQEIITDPSYAHQIITLTYPHIGNIGINPDDEESSIIHAHGLVIRDLSLNYSHFRSTESLSDYLKRHQTVAIADIDTRKLTRLLRKKGTQNGCIITNHNLDVNLALEKIKLFSEIKGVDLVKEVTTKKMFSWKKENCQLKSYGFLSTKTLEQPSYHVVVYDFGVKQNILRLLVDRSCYLTVVPATTPANEVLKIVPDGIFLSNGPGDPTVCDYAITAIKQFLIKEIPIFGICLGYQLLALASGANTIKMKFGHHGGNHPVKDLVNNRLMITTQNHGFAVDETSLSDELQVTHRSLFDGSLQGIHYTNKPAFGFQGHPEASPGPKDAELLFDYFIELMKNYRQINLATQVD